LWASVFVLSVATFVLSALSVQLLGAINARMQRY